MKRIILIAIALSLSACANMTPGQKTAALIGSAVIVGVVIASSDSGSSQRPCKPTIGGSGSDFDFSCR